MTKAEIIAADTVVRRCAGPLLLTSAQRATGYRKVQARIKEGDLAGLVAYIEGLDRVLHRVPPRFYELRDTDPATHEKVTDAAAAALHEQRPAGALELDDLTEAIGYLLEARTPCGEDVRPLIEAEAFDGRDHVAPCPKCGNPIEWTAPLADDERERIALADKAALEAALGS